MKNRLTYEEMIHLKYRIDSLVSYVNHKKYYRDIAQIITPNRDGIKSLKQLTGTQILELTQYLDNVESNGEKFIDDNDSDDEFIL